MAKAIMGCAIFYHLNNLMSKSKQTQQNKNSTYPKGISHLFNGLTCVITVSSLIWISSLCCTHLLLLWSVSGQQEDEKLRAWVSTCEVQDENCLHRSVDQGTCRLFWQKSTGGFRMRLYLCISLAQLWSASLWLCSGQLPSGYLPSGQFPWDFWGQI